MTGYLNFKLPYTIKKTRNYYVSRCPLIDVCSQGETEKEAIANLVEATSLFLISCLERQTLDKVMRACGAIVGKNIVRKTPAGKRYINIPFPISSTPQKECRA